MASSIACLSEKEAIPKNRPKIELFFVESVAAATISTLVTEGGRERERERCEVGEREGGREKERETKSAVAARSPVAVVGARALAFVVADVGDDFFRRQQFLRRDADARVKLPPCVCVCLRAWMRAYVCVSACWCAQQQQHAKEEKIVFRKVSSLTLPLSLLFLWQYGCRCLLRRRTLELLFSDPHRLNLCLSVKRHDPHFFPGYEPTTCEKKSLHLLPIFLGLNRNLSRFL